MKKTDAAKAQLVEQLRRTPIVQVACEKLGVARATFYRWKAEDAAFAAAADTALREGCALVSDLAESQLIGAIKDRNLAAVTYWLRHRHPAYRATVEVGGALRVEPELTKEQRALVERALRLAGLNPDPNG